MAERNWVEQLKQFNARHAADKPGELHMNCSLQSTSICTRGCPGEFKFFEGDRLIGDQRGCRIVEGLLLLKDPISD